MDWKKIEQLTGVDLSDELFVLAGAGVSMDSPSSCLSGFEIVSFLLDVLSPSNEIREDLCRYAFPASFPVRQSILRFEHLIAVIQNAIDPSLSFLYDLFGDKKPNANHYMLAGLIKKGHCVVTTNFDMNIEMALENNSYQYKVAGIDDWTPNDENLPRGFLGKIHGSLYAYNKISPQTIQSTIRSILTGSSDQVAMAYKPRSSEDFFKSMIKSRTLIILGYSGYDDFDIVRWLLETSCDQTIIWIKHADQDQSELETVSDLKLKFELTNRFTYKSDEILYTMASNGSRPASRIFQLVGHTHKILKALSQTHSDESFKKNGKTFPNDFNLAENQKWLATANIYMQLDEFKKAHNAFTNAAAKTPDTEPEIRHIGYYNAADIAIKLQDYNNALINVRLAKTESARSGTEYRRMLTLFMESRILFVMAKKEDFQVALTGFREVNAFIINKIQVIEKKIQNNLRYTSDDIRELKRDKELHAVCTYNELKMLSWTNLLNQDFIQKFESLANYCGQLGIYHIEYHAKIDVLLLKKHFQLLSNAEIIKEKERLIKEIKDFGIPYKDFFIGSIENI